MLGNSEEIVRKCEETLKKYVADLLVSEGLVSIMRMSEFIKPCPNMYTNAKRMRKHIMWFVDEQHSPSFAYAAYVRQTGKCYPSGVSISKKNTFAIVLMWTYIHSGSHRMTSGTLARSLVWRTLNKQLFGICSHLPRSRIPCLRPYTDVDAPLKCLVNVSPHVCHKKWPTTESTTDEAMPHTFCIARLVAVAAICVSYVNTRI